MGSDKINDIDDRNYQATMLPPAVMSSRSNHNLEQRFQKHKIIGSCHLSYKATPLGDILHDKEAQNSSEH